MRVLHKYIADAVADQNIIDPQIGNVAPNGAAVPNIGNVAPNGAAVGM